MRTHLLRKLLQGALVAGTCLVGPLAWGATWYVKASGSGTGSSWADAWGGFAAIGWASVQPGDMIYVAGGTYGTLVVAKGGTAGAPLTVKRATKADHGSSAGWVDSYDDRVIIDGGGGFAAVNIGDSVQADYVTIDGATRYGIWAKHATYGVHPSQSIPNTGTANNLTLRYMEIGDAGSGRLGEDGIQGIGNDLTVENCYIHDVDSTVTHGDGIQWFKGVGLVIRYNLFKNTGQAVYGGEAAWGDSLDNVEIYYNVFFNRGGTHYNGIVPNTNSPRPGYYWHVYNNTFDLEATTDDGYNSVITTHPPNGPIDIRNNAFIYSAVAGIASYAHAFNGYDNSGTFANKLNGYPSPADSETGAVVAADLGFTNVSTAADNAADYHLLATSPLIGKGSPVGLAVDFDGKPIPATPSIGAFEYNAAASPSLAAPTHLVVNP